MNLEDLPTDSLSEFLAATETLSCSDLGELLEQGISLLDPKPQELDPSKPALFHGDLHGDIETPFEVWRKVGDIKGFNLIFLGDYVDRGPNQIETLLLVLSLKAKRPEEVAVLRGNHEPPRNLIPSPHDYPIELRERCGDEMELYELSLKLFDRMPLFAIYGRYLGVHGGPPFRKGCKGISCLDQPDLEAVLWSDPDELLGEEICAYEDPLEKCIERNYYRGAGYIWGAGATREFLEATGFEKIVRGHTAVNGIAFTHRNRVITLFTRRGPPYYNERAAALLVKGEEKAVLV
ncbi:serine/threonine protein phosphatase [Ignicoccus islandicus DSM 13165]|uniref:Serine/threonine protein phosphatase n=1 Tax=Ignicoccus islandicus DSM 13165 TaxID=940295 RepID=A0A0U3FPX4_9CREN|nr:metallophosphoesterase family protein [Ignicoccus islandicus]ALU11536.1 serine/threonine protein phosphatase [Ignicoccus islandicus DSM 13165]